MVVQILEQTKLKFYVFCILYVYYEFYIFSGGTSTKEFYIYLSYLFSTIRYYPDT